MKRLLFPLALLSLLLIGGLPAEAATCFWVGGTATWSTGNTASWSSSTGGTAGTCAATGGVPNNAGDVATFDGSSGGGTVTVNLNATLGAITSSAYTGTLDFSANTNTITLGTAPGWTDAGTGTHTIKLGADTFNVTCAGSSFGTCWNWSGASTTLTAGTSTINFTVTGTCSPVSGSGNFNFNGKTYATVTFTGGGCIYNIVGTNTFGNLTLTGPVSLTWPQVTTTVSNAYTWTGTSGNTVSLLCLGSSGCVISTPSGSTGTWIQLLGMNFSSHAPTFTNCTQSSSSNATCTAPSVSGGTLIGG